MYLNWLTERILRLEDDVRLYSAQCVAQAQETKAVKESLAEATMELEVIKLLMPTITRRCCCLAVDHHHGETEALPTVDKQLDRHES